MCGELENGVEAKRAEGLCVFSVCEAWREKEGRLKLIKHTHGK